MAVGVINRQKEGQKTPTRTFSKKQETDIAKAVGGMRTKNSGATLFQKGDVLTKKFLLEAKTKTKPSDSIKINKDWFQKNIEECLLMGKPYSAIVFNFGPGEKNHYIIDEDLFIRLCEVLENE